MPVYYTTDKKGNEYYYKHGKRISANAVGDEKVFRIKKKCADNEILNENTQRCVLRTSKIGKGVIKANQTTRPPTGKMLNPQTGKFIDRNGVMGKQIKHIQSFKKAKWFLFTIDGCPYCSEAKRLLKNKNESFITQKVTRTNAEQVYFYTDPVTNDYRYFPMVFHDGKFVGGYDKLSSMRV